MREKTPPQGDIGRARWLLTILIASYLASVAVVATQGARPMVDEWIYIDAARQFAETGQLDVAPIAFALTIFEAVFGGVILWVSGGSLITLVMATAVLASVAGVALWDLLTRSGVRASLALLVVGAFLFSSVFYALTTTYMTDTHAVSLMVIAAALFSRGIDEGPYLRSWLVAGSIVAATGYLSRPGAIGVVAGVTIVAAVRRQWSAIVWALAAPLVILVAHLVGQSMGILPTLRSDITERLMIPSSSTWVHVLFLSAMYVGIWLIPLGLQIGNRIMDRGRPRLARISILIWAVVIVGTLAAARNLPMAGNWLNRTGMFPIDESTVGSRPLLVDWPSYLLFAVIAVLIAVCAFVAIFASRDKPELRSAEIGLWVGGCLSLSLVVFTQVAVWGRILDRYLIVLLPAVLFSLAVRGLNQKRTLFQRSSWLVLGVIASLTVFLAIDGTRVQRAVFMSAEAAQLDGIAPEEIDGGAAWTGTMFGLDMEPDEAVRVEGEEWWRGTFAPGLSPRYVVMVNPDEEPCVTHVHPVRTFLGNDSRVGLVDTECQP